MKTDPRHFQILTLSTLLGLQFFFSDFGPSSAVIFVTLASVLVFQIIFLTTKAPRHQESTNHKTLVSLCLSGLKTFDLRSALISGLSLIILFKAASIWLYPLAALITIGSKFLIRIDNKHIFNPTNFGIVVMLLLFPHMSWVSTGQWGSSIWFGLLLACLGFLVLHKIPRRDMGPLFLGIWAALIFGRALWLGDPLSIPLHQIQNGALLIFCFFMISDPKTIPDHFKGRLVFALAVAIMAFILQFAFQVREGLFYALVAACMLRPVLDRLWIGKTFEWQNV